MKKGFLIGFSVILLLWASAIVTYIFYLSPEKIVTKSLDKFSNYLNVGNQNLDDYDTLGVKGSLSLEQRLL